ncbi:nitrous oxide reductase accessory protein NosL [Viridibacillus sp. YIM B01967]|uniref:Nitrous oxide reductase accessory protein NosL n=2 Tax=Viridibacillus soli TaxID=2798301 RepID=A0ABS1H9X3_9BACL|nr:nitrous oxide reductase accessory protein NosL [Viridibacillus soli]
MLQACGNKEYKPREIVSETDVCEVCNMSIVHEDYAGQIALKNGDYKMFDDLGCLVEYMEDMDNDNLGQAFIKDGGGKDWVDVKTASYVYDKETWTPMSYGVIAFKSEGAAKDWMSEKKVGKLLSFADLEDFKWGVHH